MTARQTFDSVLTRFRAPHDRGPWRADLALGSGLTALAVEAALRDVALLRGGGPVQVIGDPSMLARIGIDPRGGRVLGCSFSTRSAEVLDGLAQLRARGQGCDLHGVGPDADLPIPAQDVPHALRHLVFCATVPLLLNSPLPSPIAAAPQVAPFLHDVVLSGRLLLCIGDRDAFRIRLLLSYWLEYLRRPGFRLVFPDLTHDFLWADTRATLAGAAFVLEPPPADLSDHRFRRLVDLLRGAGAPCLVLEPAPTPTPGSHVAQLIAITDDMFRLATACRCDLETTLTFDNWNSPPSR
ncbi:MAG: hypothetical protein P4M00_04330 [Azospirillaceae bacterium]|nr:hypothetical protein [Azospirillaceae bacterium]